ncbi:MAG: HXXEE domain-containing protein [Pseudomonadota bacterium]
MRFNALRWTFLPAVAVHNFEEWLTIPYFPDEGTTFNSGLAAPPWQVMEIALVIVTLLPSAIIIWAATGLQRVHKDWAICWLGSIFCANVFVPHVAASILTMGYTPGVASAIVLILPLCLLLFRQALVERRVTKLQLAGVFVIGAISLPLLIVLSFHAAELLTNI